MINAINSLLPPANEVCEGYVFTGVCLHWGVWPITCWDTPPVRHPHGQTSPWPDPPWPDPPPPPGRWADIPPGQTPPLQTAPLCSACWDTDNTRAVGILLECILVWFLSPHHHNSIIPDFPECILKLLAHINRLIR